jgi:uncharacterized surface protein with fasciclin (FAS1) repeats
MRLHVVIVHALLAGPLAACAPRPRLIDHSGDVNNGVNIVPPAVLAASKSAPTTLPASAADVPDLIQTISDSQQKHFDVIEVIRQAGLMRTLSDTGDYTVLAPTDEAFAKLPPGRLDWLLLPQNHDRLMQFAQYHLIRGRITDGELKATDGTVKSYSGLPLVIRGVDGKVVINDANVIKSDTTASNGNIFWIDSVLDPELVK